MNLLTTRWYPSHQQFRKVYGTPSLFQSVRLKAWMRERRCVSGSAYYLKGAAQNDDLIINNQLFFVGYIPVVHTP